MHTAEAQELERDCIIKLEQQIATIECTTQPSKQGPPPSYTPACSSVTSTPLSSPEQQNITDDQRSSNGSFSSDERRTDSPDPHKKVNTAPLPF